MLRRFLAQRPLERKVRFLFVNLQKQVIKLTRTQADTVLLLDMLL